MKAIKYWIILLLISAAGQAQAAPYFAVNTIDPQLLTPPLAPHSADWEAEVQSIIALQQAPDQNALEQAKVEQKMAPEMVATAVDPSLTRQTYPALYRLLGNVGDTTWPIDNAAKKFWHTERPYLADTRVKSLIDPPRNSPAYPSGHTYGSYMWAYVLSELLPEKRAYFMARAAEIAQHRVLVGVHYPHDLMGGRELALLTLGALLQNAQFKQDFAAAKQELDNHSATKP